MEALFGKFWTISLGDMAVIIFIAFFVGGLLIGFMFGRAATIGGPEHRDPTEAEIKAAKERYRNEYLEYRGRPNDSLPPINRSDEE